MPRELKTEVLSTAAEYYAGTFMANRAPFNRDWVMKEFYKFAYKDAFDYLVEAMRGELGEKARSDFEARLAKFEPRGDEAFAFELADRLAIDLDGNHIKGKIGYVSVGGRPMGTHIIEVEPPDSIMRRHRLGLDKTHREVVHKVRKLNWPIYAGEEEERSLKHGGASDPFPHPAETMTMMALNMSISNEIAILGLDALLLGLDEGTLGALLTGYGDTIPTDADTAVGAQTKLFNCEANGTVTFGAARATDGTGKATSTNLTAFDDETNADATDTLTWVRAASSSSASVALDDHIDGSAGTATVDWTFNTAAIVAAATVSITSWIVELSEG